jgi:epoxyqueuosine reductase
MFSHEKSMSGPPGRLSTIALTDLVKQHAVALGFRRAGVCPAVSPRGHSRFERWLDEGYAGEMRYFFDRREAYRHPASVLEGVRSIVMLVYDYASAVPRPAAPGEGRVSRYAWGRRDYHDVIRARLHQLADRVREAVPGARVRGVVDTAPLLERDFAQLAGIGWIGKNTLLIDKEAGSWFFLAALLTDLILEYDTPFAADHCGTCRACLDACPTGAFPAPYVLDATRCISYLTIELRGPVPAELRDAMGPWLFGCDVCQEVCPWNRQAVSSPDSAFAPVPEMNPLELTMLFALDDEAFRRRFRPTPLWRSKRRGLLRNAAIVLGSQPVAEGLPSLIQGLSDSEPVVRGASAWALGRYSQPAARQALEARLKVESNADVRQEIGGALKATQSRDHGLDSSTGG